MKTLKKSVLAIIVILLCAQVVCATDPLLIQVACQGCSTQNEYNFYANAGETITFTVSSTGGTGSKSYKWTKEGVLVHNSVAPFPITVTENAEYNLIVADSRGYISKTIKTFPISQEKSKCLPSFRSDIILDDRLNREEYSIGDSFELKVYLDEKDCPSPKYELCWITDDPNIIFVSPNSTKTEVIIGQGTKNGDVEIEVIITNPFTKNARSRNINIEIVSNTPPQFEIEHSKPPIYSCEWFEVWPSNFKPGERGESGDFLHSCSAVLKNENGTIVSSAAPRTAARNGKVPHLRLKPDGFKEIYSIEMTVVDSHGASTIVIGYIGNISRGQNDRNAPVVYAPDTIYCVVNEVCEIDASETTHKDRYVSNFRFYDIGAKEQLKNPREDYCSGSVCSHIFTYPGTYRIEIKANYFDKDLDDYRESEIGSKIVTVIVISNVSAIPTLTITPTLKPTPKPTLTPVPTPKSAPTSTPALEKTPAPTKNFLENFWETIGNIIKALF